MKKCLEYLFPHVHLPSSNTKIISSIPVQYNKRKPYPEFVVVLSRPLYCRIDSPFETTTSDTLQIFAGDIKKSNWMISLSNAYNTLKILTKQVWPVDVFQIKTLFSLGKTGRSSSATKYMSSDTFLDDLLEDSETTNMFEVIFTFEWQSIWDGSLLYGSRAECK